MLVEATRSSKRATIEVFPAMFFAKTTSSKRKERKINSAHHTHTQQTRERSRAANLNSATSAGFNDILRMRSIHQCASFRIPMALVTNHEDGGVQLTRRLTLGCELSCTTIQGDTFRGNLVAHDEKENLIVISILRYLPPCVCT